MEPETASPEVSHIMGDVLLSRRRWIVVGCLCAAVGASRPVPAIENWTSTRQIRSLAAWRGQVWAASAGGLLGLDPEGRASAKRTTADGLPETDLLQVRPAGERLLLVGRRTLALFQDGRAAPLPPLPGRDTARGTSVAVLPHSMFVISGAGLYRFDLASTRPESRGAWAEVATPEKPCFVADAGGLLWLLGETALWTSRDGRVWGRAAAAPDRTGAGLPVGMAYAGGRWVLGARRGLHILDAGAWRTVPLSRIPDAAHVAELQPDGARLLIAAYGAGLWSFDPLDPERSLRPHASNASSTIRCSLSVEGVLWAGTTEGVRRWSPGGGWTTPAVSAEPPGNACIALARHDGAVWLSTQQGGLARWQEGRWETDVGLERPHVLHLAAAGSQLWARSPDGTVSIREAGSGVWRAWEPGKKDRLSWISGLWGAGDAFWLGTWAGVSRWRPAAAPERADWLKVPLLKGQTVTAVAEHRGETWVGTAWRGLAVRDSRGAWRAYHEGGGLPDGWITALASDGERLWAGTFNGGLVAWDGARWTPALPISGLEGRRVTSLAVDREGGLWVGSRGGLARRRAGRWRVWTAAQGLAGNEVQCLLADGDTVWVGTQAGLSRIPQCEWNDGGEETR